MSRSFERTVEFDVVPIITPPGSILGPPKCETHYGLTVTARFYVSGTIDGGWGLPSVAMCEECLTEMESNGMSTTLAERRAEWERSGTVLATVEHHDTGALYVIVKWPYDYSLHRYFRIGQQWEVSVDVQHHGLEECVFRMGEAFTP